MSDKIGKGMEDKDAGVLADLFISATNRMLTKHDKVLIELLGVLSAHKLEPAEGVMLALRIAAYGHMEEPMSKGQTVKQLAMTFQMLAGMSLCTLHATLNEPALDE